MLPWESNSKPDLREVLALAGFRQFLKSAAGEPPMGAPAEDVPEAAPAMDSSAVAMPEPDQSGLARALAGMVSHELKLQLAYLFYAETMQGVGRGELAELFRDLAKQEVDDAAYLMRRLSVMQPGGVLIPPPASPEPSTDPSAIVEVMIADEQRGIAYLTAIHGMLGDDPMKYTVESMLSEEQEHLDRLVQHREPAASPAPEAVAPEAMPDVPVEASAAEPPPEQAAEMAPKTAGLEDESSEMASLANMPIEQYLVRDQALQIQQHQNELAHTKAQLQESQQQATAASMQMEQMQQTTSQLQMQADQAQQAAQAASQQAQMAAEQATASSENAAQQAEAKMRLSMRVQQMRQMLADIASSDPVAEEGLGFGSQAGPGAPQTSQQQQAQAQMEQQQMAAQQAQDPQAGGEANEQGAEAARAQGEAQKQTDQAAQAAQKPGGNTVTVKTSLSAIEYAVLGGLTALGGGAVGHALGKRKGVVEGRLHGEVAERERYKSLLGARDANDGYLGHELTANPEKWLHAPGTSDLYHSEDITDQTPSGVLPLTKETGRDYLVEMLKRRGVKTSGLLEAVKSAGWRDTAAMGALGAATGGIAGGITGGEGHRLEGASRGALVGGALGAGSNVLGGHRMAAHDALLATPISMKEVEAARAFLPTDAPWGTAVRKARDISNARLRSLVHQANAADLAGLVGAPVAGGFAGRTARPKDSVDGATIQPVGEPISVTDKSAGASDFLRNAAAAAGHDAGYGAVKGGVRAVGDLIAPHKSELTAAGVLGAGTLALRSHAKARREERAAKALETLAGTR